MRNFRTLALAALVALLGLAATSDASLINIGGSRSAAAAPDTTPNAFSFTDQTDVTTSSTITSTAITVAGINAAATITVSGGTYDVNASGSFTSSSGSVNNGDTVRARHTSSASNSTATNTAVTIGGVSDTFTSTTEASAGAQSFLTRSTQPSVTMATNFPDAPSVNDELHGDSIGALAENPPTADFAFQMSDDPIVGTYMRLAVPQYLPDQTAQWRRELSDAFNSDDDSFGSTKFYVSYLVRMGPNRNTHVSSSAGYKIMNIAGRQDSNTGHEIVINNPFGATNVLGAYRNWGGCPGGAGACNFNDNDPDFLEAGLDNGSGIADPNDRFCMDVGLGVPSDGCYLIPENRWMEIYLEIKIQTYGGSTGNTIDIYSMEEGHSARRHVWSRTNFGIGSDAEYPNGVNTLWLLGYDTDRTTSAATFSTWMDYSNVVVSTAPIAVPAELANADPTDPTWKQTLSTNKRWGHVGTNTLDDVGVPAALILAYSGGTVDQKGQRVLMTGGGHSDHISNSIFGIDLSANTPAFAVFLASNTGGAVQSDPDHSVNGAGTYPNGQMRSTHSYANSVYASNKFIQAGLGAMYDNNGDWTSAIFTSNNATSAWAARGKGLSTSSGNEYRGGSSAWDPKTHRVWTVSTVGNASKAYFSFDPDSGDVDLYDCPFTDGPNYSWSVILPEERLWVASFTGVGSGFYYLDLDNPTACFQPFTVNQTAVSVAANVDGINPGAVYDPISRKIFLWHNNGTSVRALSVPTNAPSGTWTSSLITAAGGGVTPTSAAPQGTFGRFNILLRSYDGRRWLTLINATGEPLDAYPIPEIGM